MTAQEKLREKMCRDAITHLFQGKEPLPIMDQVSLVTIMMNVQDDLDFMKTTLKTSMSLVDVSAALAMLVILTLKDQPMVLAPEPMEIM